VRDRARLVDALLKTAWSMHVGEHVRDVALIAVGGYGRGELNLCSDIDIMILLPKSESAPWQGSLEKFLTFMWDIGLEVGHSVRTIDDCQRESAADVSVATTMIEARLLQGPELLFEAMRRALAPERVWPTRDFFEAKVAEQTARHHRYYDTAYNLEPNVKSSPGGLRDIQTIGWVAKRHFGAESLDELVDHGFLTRSELRKLKTAQSFLWKVRFALHVLTARREDRLLFDHQIRLAKMFGYEDATYTLAVEQFMQRYYRTAMDVSLLNEMLLQLFREAISDSNVPPVPVNARFQIRNDFLEVTGDDVFDRYPSAMLELFVMIEQNSEKIRGVRASTIRQLTRHLWLIDEEFRQHPRNHRLFFEILSAPVGVTHELRRMNLYGVLGRYIPAFGRIVGRMQYDLFHAYTVDAHTLFVVSNLRRFAMPKYDHEFPALSRIMQSLPKQELAYLAAIFHDIAKGRGGDHSELGSVDAEAFCLEQGLSRYDARLVAWLVRNHLVLSVTSQKKDISDPKVVNEFARHVGDQTHLDYLYVLTVADVRGTNPKLWNNWKSSLFAEFYERTRQALRRGHESPLDNVKVRQALNMAINKDRITRILNGRATPANQPLPPLMPGYDKSFTGYAYDVAKAKALLAEAGYPDGFETVLYSTNTDPQPRIAQAIQQDLAAVGVKAEVRALAQANVISAGGTEGEAPMIWSGGMAWIADFPDPSNFYGPILGCAGAVPGGWNWSWYCNADLDKRAVAADSMSDPAKATERTAAWGKIFTDIMADAPWIPVINERRVVAKSLRMGGADNIYIDPTRVINYDAIYVKQ
jgi:[protein-PII] uridylyltransferase